MFVKIYEIKNLDTVELKSVIILKSCLFIPFTYVYVYISSFTCIDV